MKALAPTPLRRQLVSAIGTLVTRSLAAAGLFLAAVLAAAAHRGLVSLAFLTTTALVGIGVARARRRVREAHNELRFHRAVGNTLNSLLGAGWHLKRNVRWPVRGHGHLAMVPSGELAFAIKDCPHSAGDFDFAQTQEFATALSRTGRPYVPICVEGRAAGRSSSQRGVICCSPELLLGELRDAERAFAVSLANEAAQHELLYSESTAGH